jgi:hypothetical protein
MPGNDSRILCLARATKHLFAAQCQVRSLEGIQGCEMLETLNVHGAVDVKDIRPILGLRYGQCRPGTTLLLPIMKTGVSIPNNTTFTTGPRRGFRSISRVMLSNDVTKG